MATKKIEISDVEKVRRPVLGDSIPVKFWRMFSLVGIEGVHRGKSEDELYKIGHYLGGLLNVESVQGINDAITSMKIGITHPVDVKENFIAIEFFECVSCSGIVPPIGRAICFFEVGLVAGAIELGLKKKITNIVETKCIGGLGDTVCRVEATIE